MGNKPSAKIFEMHSPSEWKENLEASKQSDKLLVVNFTATWCGPGKGLEPVTEDYSETDTDIKFIKIDVDTLPDVSGDYKVETLPTFVLIKKGSEVARLGGAKKTELKKLIGKHRTGI